VSGGGIFGRESPIELMLGPVHIRIRDGDPQLAQSGGSDQDKQRTIRDHAGGEIIKTAAHEIRPR